MNEYNLCVPEERITYRKMNKRGEIIPSGSFTRILESFQGSFMHQAVYENILNIVEVFSSDNPWLGDTYVHPPRVEPFERLPHRIAILVNAFGRFQFTDRKFHWKYSNDPYAVDIQKA